MKTLKNKTINRVFNEITDGLSKDEFEYNYYSLFQKFSEKIKRLKITADQNYFFWYLSGSRFYKEGDVMDEESIFDFLAWQNNLTEEGEAFRIFCGEEARMVYEEQNKGGLK